MTTISLDISKTFVRMLAGRDRLLVDSSVVVQPGDELEIEGCMVSVTNVKTALGRWGPIVAYALDVSGEQVAALREKMTFRIER